MQKPFKINAAIQVLVPENNDFSYSIVDEVIEYIRSSGLTYVVCPFETVVEGTFQEVIDLLAGIKECCFRDGASDIIINLKLQIGNNKDITIPDKMHKYENLADSFKSASEPQ